MPRIVLYTLLGTTHFVNKKNSYQARSKQVDFCTRLEDMRVYKLATGYYIENIGIRVSIGLLLDDWTSCKRLVRVR